jgi:hypothetical protein
MEAIRLGVRGGSSIVRSTVYHPSEETALPYYLIKIAARVLTSSRIIELWFKAW